MLVLQDKVHKEPSDVTISFDNKNTIRWFRMLAAQDLILGLHLVGYNGSWKFDICNFEAMLPYICNDIRKQMRNYNIYKKSRISVLRSEKTSKH
jgi:hypothetical protein